MSGRFLRPLLFFGFLATIGLLSLADRAPDLVKTGWTGVQEIGSSIEQRVGVDVVDRSDIPLAFDTLGHLALWAVAGGLAYLAFGHRTSPWFLMVSLFTLSAGVEVGQRFLSATRKPDVVDLAANGVGIAFGLVVAMGVLSVTGLFGRLTNSLTR